MTIGRLWAGWRREYIETADHDTGGCVFCRILTSDEAPEATYVLWRDAHSAVVLNAYPYTSGHLMAMPARHVGSPEDLDADESASLWAAMTAGVRALRAAYRPDGINVGANVGRAAGAGVPDHLHLHCVPRWAGDTNFLTTVAEARVLPESLAVTFEKVRKAWPSG